jgi:transcriptional regulator with XRE-family HTH domain
MTLDGLAASVGTSRRHMIRLEKGQNVPGAEFRARIARATQQPAELFADTEDDEESDPVAVDLVKTLMRRLNEQVEHSIEERVEAALRERGL